MKTGTASALIKYFELLAGMAGIFCYYKNKKSIWFAFAVFLVLLFGMEALGGWYGKHKMYVQNTNLYKWIVTPLIITMYHAVYYTILSKKFKPIVMGSAIILLFGVLIENIYLGKEHFYAVSIAQSVFCVAILFFSMLYFFGLLKGHEILHFKKLMPFWFCTGLLIFYLGCFPYLTFFNSMAIAHNKSIAHAYRWIFILLNYIMYLLFTLGFIWSKPKQ